MGTLKTKTQTPDINKIKFIEKKPSELKIMTSKQLYTELTKHLVEDAKPSEYLNRISHSGGFNAFPFSMLKALEKVPQSPVHHPEGCVWNHVCLVVDQAALVRQKSHAPTAFMWAALLHDIGKAKTTRMRRGKITAYDHDTVGAELCIEFLSHLTEDEAFIKMVSMLVKYHMHTLYILKSLPFANIQGMNAETKIEEIALLGFCDRMGRLGSNIEEEQKNYQEFLMKCQL
ncbi:MAG: HDIG domain-containing protein [[Clostridium] symbiosum]|nr:HDIG domain-containing protein [[Clostridium] symbiosum]